MRTNRRTLLSGATVITAGALTAALTGCQSSGTDTVGQRGGSDGTKSPAAPSSVRHKFGTTSVPSGVERVVTVGWNDQDSVLPFGIVPVGVRGWFDNYDTLPWVKQVTDGKKLKVTSTDEIDFEAIAAARPELILAIYETIDKSTYRRLSQIAPTVVQPDGHPDEETTLGRAVVDHR